MQRSVNVQMMIGLMVVATSAVAQTKSLGWGTLSSKI